GAVCAGAVCAGADLPGVACTGAVGAVGFAGALAACCGAAEDTNVITANITQSVPNNMQRAFIALSPRDSARIYCLRLNGLDADTGLLRWIRRPRHGGAPLKMCGCALQQIARADR